MKIPGATGEMTGEPRSSRLNSPAAEKWVCWEEPIGPESEAADWPSESLVQLLPEVAFVGGEAGEGRGCRVGTPQLQQFAVELAAAAFGDDVHDAAGAAAEFGGEGVGENVHLLHGGERQAAEHGLAAPGLVAGAAIHHERWSDAGPRRWW